ncbi:MAG: hypothetical protein ACRDPY_21645 [Streptosporangiaceae bacterium]
MTGQWRLRLALGEPDQVPRLAAFRAAHPGVIVSEGEFGTWQAQIPEENGETFVCRYQLRQLLDRLGELLGGTPSTGRPPDPKAR